MRLVRGFGKLQQIALRKALAALSLAGVIQSSPRPVSLLLGFGLERPEGLNLSFPACKEQARSVAAVKEDDEGVTAQAALCVLDRCVSEGRRGW
jgi:hypothetical protein